MIDTSEVRTEPALRRRVDAHWSTEAEVALVLAAKQRDCSVTPPPPPSLWDWLYGCSS